MTYKALGSTLSTATAYVQDVINLPTTATAVDGYTFVGWTTSTVAETTSNAEMTAIFLNIMAFCLCFKALI